MSYSLLDQETQSDLLATDASALLGIPVTILVVDDHTLIRSAISQILASHPEVKLVVTAQDYAEAEAQVVKACPDIIWLDMHVAHLDSIAEIRRLRKLAPNSRIMALADVENEQEAFAAIMSGVQGYRSKQDVDPDEIMLIIYMLCRDEFVLRPALMTRLMQRLRVEALPLWNFEHDSGGYHTLLSNVQLDGLTRLTTREREILQLISQGYRDRDIAEGLHISEKTVQKHVQSILSKLGAQNRTEAAYIIRHRLIL